MELGTGERKRGLWTDEEDKILMKHVELYGKGKWNRIAKKTGLKRCGKSCRLRWVNYLSPSVKKGSFTEEEEDLIIRLHKLLGNRWSLIAGRVPGRTDNQVKNYWNTHLCKRNGCGKKQRTKSCTTNTDKKSVTCSKDSETRTSCSSLASLTNLGGNIISTGKTHNVEQDNKAMENSVIDDASLLSRNTYRFVTDGENYASSSAWKDQVDKEMMSSFVPFSDDFLQFDFGWSNMSSRFSN